VTARILLVDDDAKMVELVSGILADDGYEVFGTTTAAEALELAGRLAPDVIVLDEVMPDRTGLDVAGEIRESSPEQAIIIFSSLFDLRLSDEVRRLGFRYVEKADGIDALERAIREVQPKRP
jgi:DNA-binding response OmpR family regulator